MSRLRRAPVGLASLLRLGLVAAALLTAAPPARAAPPEQGDCPTVVGAPLLEEGKGLVDAPPLELKPGMLLEIGHLPMLRRLLPPVIWQHREAFFFEGMRLEIGDCHRRYPTFSLYRQATERFAGQAKLDDAGNLESYTAGLPFPPDRIDPEKDPQAAAKWAWDLEHRFRGAGFRGNFRITEIPARIGGDLAFEGTFFLVQTRNRADLAESGYALGDQEHRAWAAGGRFLRPFDARHLAWRQFRPGESERDYEEPDDVFVYVPSMRKARRSATTWVDGLYMPDYGSGNEGSGGGMPYGTGSSVGAGTIAPTAGLSIAASENKGHGLTGLTLRPNAYHWRFLGERPVIAPLNAYRPGYPEESKRNYGYSGLSVASDRWDIRQAVVIEGALRRRDSKTRSIEIWIDYQTQQPLYWITRASKRRLQEIGILLHRYSGDIPGYPEWPGGIPAGVFEPVASVFYDAMAGGGGWRRESYDVRSTPFDSGELRAMTSADNLGKGR